MAPASLLQEIRIFWYLIQGFFQAVCCKCTRSMGDVPFPPPAVVARHISHEQIPAFCQQVLTRADFLVGLFIRYTTRICFFRSYTAVYVLRKFGIAVEFNVGLHHLQRQDRTTRGHCWLSWQQEPLAETTDPRVRYNGFLGTGTNGILYWRGGDQTDKQKIAHYRPAAKGSEHHVTF